VPVWYFGDAILELLKQAKEYWYLAIPLLFILVGSVSYYFNHTTKKSNKKGQH
jgi:hypothetical protein